MCRRTYTMECWSTYAYRSRRWCARCFTSYFCSSKGPFLIRGLVEAPRLTNTSVSHQPPVPCLPPQEEYPLRDFPAGYGPTASASTGSRPPTVTTLRCTRTCVDEVVFKAQRRSTQEEIDVDTLVCGCDDGAVTVRPALTPGVYARIQVHDGDSKVAAAACSCDGAWVVSGGSDGLLTVNRLKRKPFEVIQIRNGRKRTCPMTESHGGAGGRGAQCNSNVSSRNS